MRTSSGQLVSCLLLGFVTSWLSAWAMAFWLNQLQPKILKGELVNAVEAQAIWDQCRGPGWPETFRPGIVDRFDPAGQPTGSTMQQAERWRRFGTVQVLLQRFEFTFTVRGPAFDESTGEHWAIHTLRAGWPLAAMHGERCTSTTPRANDARGGWVVPLRYIFIFDLAIPTPLFGSPTMSERFIPFAPLWIGLTGNTIFYAALAWLLLFAPRLVRRGLRIRRGCCPECGYDLRATASDTCPECGHRSAVTTAAKT